MKTVVIAFLDKEWPPEHSFIDGMLAGEAAQQQNIIMRLCVSTGVAGGTGVRRYGKASCLPRLCRRKGIGRGINLLLAMGLIAYQAKREIRRGRKVVFFVRNDPVYLLASSLLKYWFHYRLVFQSSFPHEVFSGNSAMRFAAKALFRFAGHGVDVVTGVSPDGVRRTHRLFPHSIEGACIPLLADRFVGKGEISDKKNSLPVFIYAGTHHPDRQIEIVLAAVVKAEAERRCGSYKFIGAHPDEENRMLKILGVAELVRKQILTFQGPIARNDLLNELKEADIGLSLIPPKKVYIESSPTKVAEYMGAGLAVFASKGIPLQEKFVSDSGGGMLVDWGVESIADGIRSMSSDTQSLLRKKRKSAEYAHLNLNYQSYVDSFLALVCTDEE